MEKKSQRVPSDYSQKRQIPQQQQQQQPQEESFWEQLKRLPGEMASAWHNPYISDYEWHRQNAERHRQGYPLKKRPNWLQRLLLPRSLRRYYYDYNRNRY